MPIILICQESGPFAPAQEKTKLSLPYSKIWSIGRNYLVHWYVLYLVLEKSMIFPSSLVFDVNLTN